MNLDTSGPVPFPRNDPEYGAGAWRWPDLSPFAQGYVEAALRDFDVIVWPNNRTPEDTLDVRFSDLASETLAAMLKACEAHHWYATRNIRRLGAAFWRVRQEGRLYHLPPVALHLGDDGKIHQQAAS